VVDISVEVTKLTKIKLTTGRAAAQFDSLDVPENDNVLVF
jgi:hypothetical protein